MSEATKGSLERARKFRESLAGQTLYGSEIDKKIAAEFDAVAREARLDEINQMPWLFEEWKKKRIAELEAP